MWLATKFGFFSIVQKKPGEFHVRSRERSDLETLRQQARLENQIISTPKADYGFRLILKHDEVMQVFALMSLSIDYSNFKSEIGARPKQRHKLDFYHRIWSLYNTLLDPRRQKPYFDFVPGMDDDSARYDNHGQRSLPLNSPQRSKKDSRLWNNDLALSENETPDPNVTVDSSTLRRLKGWAEKHIGAEDREGIYNSIVKYLETHSVDYSQINNWWDIVDAIDAEDLQEEIRKEEAH